jgi:hypothetical protein
MVDVRRRSLSGGRSCSFLDGCHGAAIRPAPCAPVPSFPRRPPPGEPVRPAPCVHSCSRRVASYEAMRQGRRNRAAAVRVTSRSRQSPDHHFPLTELRGEISCNVRLAECFRSTQDLGPKGQSLGVCLFGTNRICAALCAQPAAQEQHSEAPGGRIARAGRPPACGWRRHGRWRVRARRDERRYG